MVIEKEWQKLNKKSSDFFKDNRIVVGVDWITEIPETKKETKHKGLLLIDHETDPDQWYVPIILYPGGSFGATVDGVRIVVIKNQPYVSVMAIEKEGSPQAREKAKMMKKLVAEKLKKFHSQQGIDLRSDQKPAL